MPVSAARNPYKPRTMQPLAWVVPFLDALASGTCVKEACRIANTNPSAAYHQRRTNDGFHTEWDLAVKLGTELLEQEAERRAYHGVEKPVFYKGMQCGSVQEYSDTLLMFVLRARRPEVYRERYDPESRSAVNVNIHTQAAAVGILNQLFNDERIPIERLDPLTIAGPPCDGGHGGEVEVSPAPESDQHGADGGVARAE